MNWYAVLPILVFGGPAAGFLWELAVGLFCRTRRYLLWVPVLAGALGLALCAASPAHTLPFSFLLQERSDSAMMAVSVMYLKLLFMVLFRHYYGKGFGQ